METEELVQICIACLIGIIYIYSYFILGISITRIFKSETFSVSFNLLIGFFSFYILFELVGLPMKLGKCPLTELAIVWGSTLLILLALLTIVHRRYMWIHLKEWIKVKKEEKNEWFTLGIFILLIIIVYGFWTPYYGISDDAYYIGDIVTSIYTNTIQQYTQLGELQQSFNKSYLISLYPMQSAAVCVLTGLHPLVEAHWVRSIIVILLTSISYYKWGIFFFKYNEKKKVFLFLAVIFWIMITFQFGFSENNMLFYRTSEGKTILENIVVPFLLYLFALLYKDIDSKINWWGIGIVATGSLSIAMSAMFIVPLALGCNVLALFLMKRKVRVIWRGIFCCVPACLVVANYMFDFIPLTI